MFPSTEFLTHPIRTPARMTLPFRHSLIAAMAAALLAGCGAGPGSQRAADTAAVQADISAGAATSHPVHKPSGRAWPASATSPALGRRFTKNPNLQSTRVPFPLGRDSPCPDIALFTGHPPPTSLPRRTLFLLPWRSHGNVYKPQG